MTNLDCTIYNIGSLFVITVPHINNLLLHVHVIKLELTSNVESTINQPTVQHPRMLCQPHMPEKTIATTKVLCWEHMVTPRLPVVFPLAIVRRLSDHSQHCKSLLMLGPDEYVTNVSWREASLNWFPRNIRSLQSSSLWTFTLEHDRI